MTPRPVFVKISAKSYANPATGQIISRRQYLNMQRGMTIEAFRAERAVYTAQTEQILIAYGVAGPAAQAAAAAYTRARTAGGRARALQGTGVTPEQVEALRIALDKQAADEPLRSSEYILLQNLGLLEKNQA
jgi:hypothetical protein